MVGEREQEIRDVVFLDSGEPPGWMPELATVFSDFAHSRGRALRILCVGVLVDDASELVELLAGQGIGAAPTLLVGLGPDSTIYSCALRDLLARGSKAALALLPAGDRDDDDSDPELLLARFSAADVIVCAALMDELLAATDTPEPSVAARLRERALCAWTAWPLPERASTARQRYAARYALHHRLAADEAGAAIELCRDLTFLCASVRERGSLAIARELDQLLELCADPRVEQLQRALLGASHWLKPELPESAAPGLIWDRMLTQVGHEQALHEWFRRPPPRRLVRQLHPLQIDSVSQVLEGHGHEIVRAVACGPEGLIASAAADGVRVWDSVTGEQRWARRGVVRGLAIVGDRLITGGAAGAIWELRSGELLSVFHGRADERAPADGDEDDDEDDDEEQGRVATIYTLFVDERRIYVAEDAALVVRDLDSGRELRRIQLSVDPAEAITVTSDGLLLYTHFGDVFIVDGEAEPRRIVHRQHEHRVMALVALADGRVVCGDQLGGVYVWSPRTGELGVRFRGHRGEINSLALAPGGRLVSAGDDQTVRIWALETGRELACLRGHSSLAMCAAVTESGSIVSGSLAGAVRIWPPVREGGADLGPPGCRGPLMGMVWHPDGRVISADPDGSLRIWDPSTGRDEPLVGRTEHDGGGYLRGLELSSRGLLVTSRYSKYVRVYEFPSLQAVGKDIEIEGGLKHFALGSNDQIVTCSDRGIIQVWDFDSRQQLSHWQGDDRWVYAMTSSRGRVATCSERSVRVWDLSGQEKARLENNLLEVVELAAGLGDSFVLGDCHGGVLVWEPERGGDPIRKQMHRGRVSVVAWTEHGLVVSGGDDGCLRAWHPPSGRVHTLAYADGPFREIAIRDDMLVTSDEIGNVWFLAVDWAALIEPC